MLASSLSGGPFARVAIRGRARFRRGWKQRRGCCCSPCRCPNLQEQFVCSMRMLFRGRRGLNTLSSCLKSCVSSPLVSSITTCLSITESFIRARVTFSRKVMSEVSVSRRRRSPSARSALPLTCTLVWSKDSIIGTVEKARKSFSTRVLGLVW
jgi:hypothetical protein